MAHGDESRFPAGLDFSFARELAGPPMPATLVRFDNALSGLAPYSQQTERWAASARFGDPTTKVTVECVSSSSTNLTKPYELLGVAARLSDNRDVVMGSGRDWPREDEMLEVEEILADTIENEDPEHGRWLREVFGIAFRGNAYTLGADVDYILDPANTPRTFLHNYEILALGETVFNGAAISGYWHTANDRALAHLAPHVVSKEVVITNPDGITYRHRTYISGKTKLEIATPGDVFRIEHANVQGHTVLTGDSNSAPSAPISDGAARQRIALQTAFRRRGDAATTEATLGAMTDAIEAALR